VIPLVDARTRFIAPVKFGEMLVLESQVSAFRRSSFEVEHRVLRGGEPATQGRETRGLGRPGRGQSGPAEVQAVAGGGRGALSRGLSRSFQWKRYPHISPENAVNG
jgi:hypothetical protein